VSRVVIDAGGGGQNYPDNYAAIAKLAAGRADDAADRLLAVRAGAGKELENYTAWAKLVKLGQGNDYYRMIGTGEYILLRGGTWPTSPRTIRCRPRASWKKSLGPW